jgi:hypothetical protein
MMLDEIQHPAHARGGHPLRRQPPAANLVPAACRPEASSPAQRRAPPLRSHGCAALAAEERLRDEGGHVHVLL